MDFFLKIMHYASALKIRFGLFLEVKKAIREGSRFNFNIRKGIWHEPHIHEEYIWLLRFIKNDENIILLDVGGNSGYWAELFLKYYPNTHSFSFEPVIEMFTMYKNRFKSNTKINVFNVALGEANSVQEINVAKGFGLTSFHQYGDFLSSKNQYFEKKESVKIETLESYKDQILLEKGNIKKIISKIDVQGFEINVLKGAKEILHHIDIMIIECSFVKEFEGCPPTFSEIVSTLREYKVQTHYMKIYQTLF